MDKLEIVKALLADSNNSTTEYGGSEIKIAILQCWACRSPQGEETKVAPNLYIGVAYSAKDPDMCKKHKLEFNPKK